MRILHILGKNQTVGTQMAFLDLVAGLAQKDVTQYAVIYPGRYLEASLERMKIPCRKAKFAGLFDLETENIVQDLKKEQQISLVVGHTPDSLRLDKKMLNLYAHLDIDSLPPVTYLDADKKDPIDRTDIQTPSDAFIIGTMTNLTKEKKLDKIIQATRELNRVHFWIAGEGPALEPLQNLATTIGLSDRVHFLGVQTNRSAFLKALDLCVIGPRKKYCDRLTLEAWSCGAPVVSGLKPDQSPGIDQEHLRLVSKNDALHWRSALQELIDDEVQRTRLRKAGFDLYQQEYRSEDIVDRYLMLFHTHSAANQA